MSIYYNQKHEYEKEYPTCVISQNDLYNAISSLPDKEVVVRIYDGYLRFFKEFSHKSDEIIKIPSYQSENYYFILTADTAKKIAAVFPFEDVWTPSNIHIEKGRKLGMKCISFINPQTELKFLKKGPNGDHI